VKHLRPDHPKIGETLKEYALLLRETKHHAEAEAMMARARGILTGNPQNQMDRYTVDMRDPKQKPKALRRIE
jgi:hypothetical protein